MSKSTFNAEEVPTSGWGVNATSPVNSNHKIPVWSIEDDEITDLQTAERTGLEARMEKREYPHWTRVFGLWNVTKAQLQDPTWKPIPYRMLDDACMIIVMVLCPVRSQLTRYWPFNFDKSGSPRQSRLRLGTGVQCHYGRYRRIGGSLTKRFESELSTFLVWKRHFIFGGAESNTMITAVGEGRTKKSKDATSDPSYWSYGMEILPSICTTVDDSSGLSLHFYLTDNGTERNKPLDDDLFDCNLAGVWFSKMQADGEIPFMMDGARRGISRTDSDSTPQQSGKELQTRQTRSKDSKRASKIDNPVAPAAQSERGEASQRGSSQGSAQRGGSRVVNSHTSSRITGDLAAEPAATRNLLPTLPQRARPRVSTTLNQVGKRPLVQMSTSQERVDKRPRPTDAEEVPSRTTTPTRSIMSSVVDRLHKKTESLTSFFHNFDALNPLPEANPQSSSQNAITLFNVVWRSDNTSPSLIEARQNRAATRYKKSIKELKMLVQNIQTTPTQTQTQTYQNLLTDKLETLLNDLSDQPALSALEDAKTFITILVEDQNDVATARRLAKSINHRLNREPRLLFDFDLDRDLPGLRGLVVQEEENLDFIPY